MLAAMWRHLLMAFWPPEWRQNATRLPPALTQTGSMSDHMSEEIDVLIRLLNEWQTTLNKFSNVGIDSIIKLPQFVITGAQSVGKSTILETFFGRDGIFETGSGIVTRCAIRCMLIQIEEGSEVYYELDHEIDATGARIQFDDVENISKKINKETGDMLAIAGKPKTDVIDAEITMRYYSPDVITLTLVDTPGLVTVDANGGKKRDAIRNLITRYAEDDNSVILCVSPASQDIQTSAGIELARDLDPKGERTLSIISKCDVTDSGDDLTPVFTNKAYKTKYGHIGVVNRGNKAKSEGQTLEEAKFHEESFFRLRYPDIAEKHGSEYLNKQLAVILASRIKKFLPRLIKFIEDNHEKYETLAKQFEGLCDSRGNINCVKVKQHV